jgi:alcohol dehydrogenase class IV
MLKTQLLCCGNSVIIDLERIIQNDSPQMIFLVTGKNSFEFCGAKNIFDKILKNISFVRFSDFAENPKIDDVEKGIKLFIDNKCDYVIAIGGGSVIDMAKLINIGQANKTNFREIVLSTKRINFSGKKFIAIPTTSGTGSEATHFAVIYIEKTKYSVAHAEYLLPDVAAIIPSLTYSLNRYQTAISGIDAFAQAVESYWSINSSPKSKKYAQESIKLIWDSLLDAVNVGDIEARDKMSTAAYLAGKAINITKTTGAHAVSYVFTSYFNIPHGHAVGLTLGEWYTFNSKIEDEDCLDPRGVKFVENIFHELNQLLGSRNSKESSTKIALLIKNSGLETKLSMLKISKEDLVLISKEVNIERMKNNPRRVSITDVQNILNNIY